MARVAALLFDLDGTLVDSAPDLAAAANHMRRERGWPELDFAELRPAASSGARGMLGLAFGIGPGQPGYEALRDEFLELYEQRMLETTVVFDAVAPVLRSLERRGLPWGIVTNKTRRLADPLARALGLVPPARVLVAGDSTPHTKPHPAPLLEAARRLDCDPARCAYVGDDPRDIVAGRAAGMFTLAAAWGYLGLGAAVHDWAADRVLQTPVELLNWLDLP
jgi:phosphoglycolate phosphatase